MKKNTATLLQVTTEVDGQGMTRRVLTPSGSIKGMMIPVNSELAGKGFGFDENISHRFFCKDGSPVLAAGNAVRYDGGEYTIVHIADYGKVKVVHLNTLIGRNNVRSVTQSLRY